MRTSAVALGTLLTAISALGFSTLPVFGVAAYRAGANVTTMLGWRFLFAAAVLWLYVWLTRKALPDRRTGLLLLLMGGCGYTTMSLLYLSSVAADRLSPSLASLLLYTYPAIVALQAWWFERQRPTARQSAAMILTMAGLVLVLIAPGAGARFTPFGALLALGAALVYATYIFFGSRVIRRTSPVVATTFVCTAAAAAFLGFGAAAGQLVPMAPAGWLAVAGMALVATVLAVLTFFSGIGRLGPAQASIVSTLEPVGTVGLSAMFFADRLSIPQLSGGALVLAGVIWLQTGSQAAAPTEPISAD